ncbi:hypothetical protein K402DRAFT_337574 [Aulographum hederae CBS 113979]|uniref:EGF-like domain-containing protein n=1 Tax=Aulographum hederae CBS 113979 TaxID=1176131 RepID=A0A6G1GSU3_9PEZI|nr:hypothetical protein K402DRAFT_337574 [Aulographum hederae CBS 113979]
MSRPFTESSQASSTSSIGSIPDFPLPISQYARPRGSIGPPPSARRGPSSYYSQFSYVSPIAEEHERGSLGSFASSNVIPSQAPSYYYEGETPSDDETPNEEKDEKKIQPDGKEAPGLVRQASLGKRHKPSVLTIPNRSSDMRSQSPLNPDRAIRSQSPLNPDRAIRSQSPMVSEEARMKEILGGLEKSGAIESPAAARARGGGLSERVGMKRPPRINVDAVKDAETRGSLTSLPELIKRATRLAANLDRGKTASRLGNEWMDISSPTEKEEILAKYMAANPGRRSVNTLSGILSSFPPPGMGTPPRSPRSLNTFWPKPATESSRTMRHYPPQYEISADAAPRGRQVCGMPMKSFVILMIVLFILLIAAIIIPVALIVIPKNDSSGSSETMTTQDCLQNNPCLNGGSNILNGTQQCVCMCSNGFTGATCATRGEAGCTTMRTQGDDNASIGDGLPRLISASQANFSIPLDSRKLLPIFSSSSLSCGAENALVTFNGQSDADPTDAITSNGIIIAASSSPTPDATVRDDNLDASSTTGSLLLAQPTSTSGDGGSSSSSGEQFFNATAMDFARVSVLFMLQETASLDRAVDAQDKFQGWFGGSGGVGLEARDVDLGDGWMADLVGMRVKVANGTWFGGGRSKSS